MTQTAIDRYFRQLEIDRLAVWRRMRRRIDNQAADWAMLCALNYELENHGRASLGPGILTSKQRKHSFNNGEKNGKR